MVNDVAILFTAPSFFPGLRFFPPLFLSNGSKDLHPCDFNPIVTGLVLPWNQMVLILIPAYSHSAANRRAGDHDLINQIRQLKCQSNHNFILILILKHVVLIW